MSVENIDNGEDSVVTLSNVKLFDRTNLSGSHFVILMCEKRETFLELSNLDFRK